MKDKKIKEMPTKDDDFIDFITANPDYKNRKNREESELS